MSSHPYLNLHRAPTPGRVLVLIVAVIVLAAAFVVALAEDALDQAPPTPTTYMVGPDGDAVEVTP